MKGARRLTTILFLLLMIFSLPLHAAQMGELSEEPQALAFPKKMAGMSAWIKLDKSIDLAKVASVFDQAVEVGKNYVLGYKIISLRIPKNDSLTTKVYLYADNQGYIIAFLDKKTPAAAMVDFSKVDFELGKIKDFSLTEVIKEAATKQGIPATLVDKKIKFYHFSYPEAQKFAIIIGMSRTKRHIHVFIPSNYNVYEVSYSFSEDDGSLYIDEKKYSDYSSKYEKLNLDKEFIIGKPHTITFWEEMENKKAGVALIIIYKE